MSKVRRDNAATLRGELEKKTEATSVIKKANQQVANLLRHGAERDKLPADLLCQAARCHLLHEGGVIYCSPQNGQKRPTGWPRSLIEEMLKEAGKAQHKATEGLTAGEGKT